jgi:hypothetical protein
MMHLGPEMAGMPAALVGLFRVDDCDAAARPRDRARRHRDDAGRTRPAGRFAILTVPQGGAFSIIKTDPDYTP